MAQITREIVHGDARLIIRRATMRDVIRRERIYWQVRQDIGNDIGHHFAHYFSRAVAQTDIEGNIGWTPPPFDASADELKQSLDQWLDIDVELAQQWFNALLLADAAQQPVELTPGGEGAAKKSKAG